MEKNKKILKYGLLIIGIVFVVNIGFSLFIRLKGPVFLKVYSESYTYDKDDRGNFEDIDYYLYYITNVNDTRRVSFINFDDVPEITAYANESIALFDIFNFNHNTNPYNDKVYGRYSLRQVRIRLNLNKLDKDFESVELNNVSIGFDNGDILEEDLGKWVIFNGRDEGDYLRRRGGGSSSGRIHGRLEVKEDIELIKIDYSMAAEIEEYMEMYIRRNNSSEISSKDVEGMEFKAGDELHIDSQIFIPDGDPKAYNVYRVLPRLFFKDKDGHIYSYVMDFMGGRYPWHYLNQDYSFMGILKYLSSRGEI